MNKQSEADLQPMRHSLAHIMATAIMRLYPDAKLGVGPVVENGFYYDVDFGDTLISEENLPAIEVEMKKVIKEDQPFERFVLPISEALQWAKDKSQPYKVELLEDLKRSGTTVAKELDASQMGVAVDGESKVEEVSFYRNGDFTDLCRGPHVEKTSMVGDFKLMRISGAYWRGNEKNKQMQRIYGVAFPTSKELNQYLVSIEEAKKRDHRKLGQELDLFTFSDLIGQGLPLWTPRGTILRKQLDTFVQELRDEFDYEEVTIPHITKKDAYIASGHWAKFEDELFKITTREGHEFAMKPMNCPHHTQIYARKPHSYRDLPVRYRETTMVYRDEQSGELAGLSRVRSITQDDAHIFCRTVQIEKEMQNTWDIIERFWGLFDIQLKVRFSRHDPNKESGYIGDAHTWDIAESQIKKIIESRVGSDYIDGPGEAAFYGPKIDFIGKDVFGREFQASTIQLDFGQPEGFDLTCIDEKGEKERIVMIHCAINGSLERSLVLLIEQTAGKFPIWLAPEQVRIITVNQEAQTIEYASSILTLAKKCGVRASVDNDNESVGKKIRNAELMKIPYTVVIGEKEIQNQELIPRIRKDIEVSAEHESCSVEHFIKTVANEAKSRVTMSSL